jgi:hypothetical protein
VGMGVCGGLKRVKSFLGQLDVLMGRAVFCGHSSDSGGGTVGQTSDLGLHIHDVWLGIDLLKLDFLVVSWTILVWLDWVDLIWAIEP